MAWLNRFSLSLLKQVPDRESVAERRRSRGWSDDYLMKSIVGSACWLTPALKPPETAAIQDRP